MDLQIKLTKDRLTREKQEEVYEYNIYTWDPSVMIILKGWLECEFI
jgi:hypothetical protein